MSQWTAGGRRRIETARAPKSMPADAVSVVSYMSPEQVLGGAVDARTDIFSLGVIVYEMLTGRNPFVAPTVEDTALNVIAARIPPTHTLSTSLEDLDALIARAMSKDIDMRPQSAASFSAELRGAGAILDVRSGMSGPSDLLPIEDDPGSSVNWWVMTAVILGVAGVAWWIFR
jgi:serine/threonine-protein kinase